MSAAAPKRALEHDAHLGHGHVSDSSEGEPSPKRAKNRTGAHPRHHHQSAAIDPTWGQKYVFSGAADASSIPYGDESDFEDDSEAMAYLRDVRCEANGIAHVKVAPTAVIGPQLPDELRTTDEDARDDGPHEPADACAYYDDGAYVAEPGQDEADSGNDGTDLQDVYFASLLDRYRRLRRILHARLPPEADSRLPSSRPTYVSSGRHPSSPTFDVWIDLMSATDPLPLQLALMSKQTVLHLLRLLLQGPFLRRGRSLTERTSRWLWALLARLPDPGEMRRFDVAQVRELGRRAVLLGTSAADMAALRAQLDDANGDVLAACEASDRADDDDAVIIHDDSDRCDDDESYVDTESHDPPPQDQDSESIEMDMSSDTDHDALDAAKTALLARLQSPPPPDKTSAPSEAKQLAFNTRATLDMVLTVVGDFYGQRDLLDFRDPFSRIACDATVGLS
ncbi:v-snare [Ophiocordyceps camponoti-floridani]|uniref:V-snare n=1 Tax=Ophiocordyceps camponoti-floridani TaxID=2030778 RepID=A0A8H4VDF4_9HYPO|nr:v-snare [Ophiocordyceps camponoti-floridani]